MQQSEPSYFGILPAVVRYDKSISMSAKVLYSELTALTNKDGYCWASNGYFSKLYGVKKETISEWFSQLKNAGYINLDYESDGKYHNGIRKITITLNENRNHLPKNRIDPSEKSEDPLPKNRKQNKTSTNNIENNDFGENTPQSDYKKNKHTPIEIANARELITLFTDRYKYLYKGEVLRIDGKEAKSIYTLVKYPMDEVKRRLKNLEWQVEKNPGFYSMTPSCFLNQYNRLVEARDRYDD